MNAAQQNDLLIRSANRQQITRGFPRLYRRRDESDRLKAAVAGGAESNNPDVNAMEYSVLVRISDKTCVLMSGVISEKASEKDIENVIEKVSVRTIP